MNFLTLAQPFDFEAPHIASSGNPPSRLNDNAPTVSMDIRLGKKYSLVDFDYQAYQNEALRLGLTDEEIGQLNIEVSKPKRDESGAYIRMGSEKIIEVVPHRDHPEGSADDILIHETKHAADEAKGLLKRDIRFRIGKIGILGLRGILPSQAIGATAGILGSKNVQDIFLFDPCQILGALGVLGAATVYGYHTHPNEIAARRAEEENTGRFFTFDRKQQSNSA